MGRKQEVGRRVSEKREGCNGSSSTRYKHDSSQTVPVILPTSVCVVEIGRPKYEASITVVAVASCAQKPRVCVSFVIFSPTVNMTRCPNTARPTTMPMPPITSTQKGTPSWMVVEMVPEGESMRGERTEGGGQQGGRGEARKGKQEAGGAGVLRTYLFV